ncbi:MAG: 16S rRNA (cytosine(967)-C(5))-methyltransferase RsmB [bacterium]
MAKRKPSARQIAVNILEQVHKKGHHADALISDSFGKQTLKQEDKSLVLELVNGTLRWRGLLDWILTDYFQGDFKSCHARLKSILELSLYQLKFLNKIPEYAAVSQGVAIAKKHGGKAWGNLVNGVLRSYLREEKSLEFPSFEIDPVSALAVRYSHPRWMVQRWLNRFGLEEAKQLCQFNNRRPMISLRVNLQKTSVEALLKTFEKYGIRAELSEYFSDFIKISKPQDLTQLPPFNEGLFSVQDESTAIACLLLAPEKGETVLDLCAAPGGKAGYLAQLMEDTGIVLAVDSNPQRMNLVKQNTRRLRLRSVVPIIANGTVFSLGKPVDKVLLDAPCSGLGVLAKRADLRWKRQLQDIYELKKLQKSLIQNAGNLVRKGGVLVYSTCTIEPEENEEVVEDFLGEHKDFELDHDSNLLNKVFMNSRGYWTTLSHKCKMDGTFSARMVKVK